MRALSEIGQVLGDLVNPPTPLVPLKEVLKLAMEEQHLRMFNQQKDLMDVAGLVYQKIRGRLFKNRDRYLGIFETMENISQVAQIIHPFVYYPRIYSLVPSSEVPDHIQLPSIEQWIAGYALRADQAVKRVVLSTQHVDGTDFALQITPVIYIMELSGLIRIVGQSPDGYAQLTDKVTPLLV